MTAQSPDHLATVLDDADEAHTNAAETLRQMKADRLTFADAVRIREDAATLDAALPRILAEQRAAGRPVTALARALDVTESYVHRLIRQHRTAQK